MYGGNSAIYRSVIVSRNFRKFCMALYKMDAE